MSPKMSSKIPCTLVWLRRDLRIIDNPALYHAAKRGQVITVYILDEKAAGKRETGQACLWWLYHSLKSLNNQLSQSNVPFILKSGDDPYSILIDLLRNYNADAIYWNRCYEPFECKRDDLVEQKLKADQINIETYQDRLMFEPWVVKTGKGGPMQIFKYYMNQCLSLPTPRNPYDKPKFSNKHLVHKQDTQTEPWQTLASMADKIDAKLKDFWCPSEDEAINRLKFFIKNLLKDYCAKNDYPAADIVSKLSPYLHFGEISPYTVWHTAHHARSSASSVNAPSDCLKQFLRSLIWREYTAHLLWHYHDLPWKYFHTRFESLELKDDKQALQSWQQGKTGYPIVDAGMRELLHTGFMHNRVRMVVGSFLTKHLLIPWQRGEEWFWDRLVDADLAQNAFNWQWVAGSGPNAAPWFRIFNPVTQGEKYDADGEYVRKWVPEIAKLPNSYIQKPWEAPKATLKAADVVLGKTYPRPIVQHKAARELALATFAKLKRKQDLPDETNAKPTKKSKSES